MSPPALDGQRGILCSAHRSLECRAPRNGAGEAIRPLPTWILLSLAFPVLLGVVNILDKLIVDRFAPAVYFYAFWIGVYEIVIGLAIVSVISAYGFETRDFLGGMLTGSIRAVGILLILSALKRGQVIRVVPVWYLYPLMVAVMAAGFLEEDLSGD